MSLSKTYQKIRKRLQQFRAYAVFSLKRPAAANAKKSVYISMKRINPNRRLFQLCAFFLESGYDCHVDLSFRQFIGMDPYGLKSVYLDGVYPAKKGKPRQYDVYVTDGDQCPSAAKTLILDYSVFNASNDYGKGLFFPIHFHPDFMNRTTETLALGNAQRATQRNIAVFFAGNCDEKSYNQKRTVDVFHIHTRWDIFSFLIDNIPGENLYVPETYEEFCRQKSTGSLLDKIVLIDINRFKIPRTDWFGILSDTDYFMHLPGYIQPWCHNQIESMASGAIPVTEFPHIFHPELKDKENAIVYTSKNELLSQLLEILRNKQGLGATAKLRAKTLAYYIDNCSFDVFSSKLGDFMQSAEKTARLYICAGDFSLDAY